MRRSTRSAVIFQTILKNVFSNYVGMLGAIIIAFVLSPFLVNTLGDTKYGIWSIISALTGYMTLLDLGVSSAIAKYVSKYKALKDYKSLNVVFASGIVIMLSVGALLLALSPFIADLVVSAFKLDPELQGTVHTLVLISALDVAIFVASGVFFGAFYGFQRNEITNAAILFAALFKAVFFYLALSRGYSLLAMGIISLVANFLAGLLLAFIMRRVEPQVEITPKNADKSTVVSIFNYSKFTFLTMLGMQLIYYSDAFVIGYFLSAAAITIYTIPWSLSEYSNKLIQAVAQTFVPVFSEQEATNNESLYKTYISGTKAVLLLSNLLCIGVLVLGDYFIGIWMGPRYAVECATILTIMFTTQLIKSPQLLSYSILLGTANHQRFAKLNFAFSFANLLLSIMLVQKFGLVGVATATAVTQILFYAVVTPVITSKVIKFSILDYVKQTYLRIIPASLVLVIILAYYAIHSPPTGYFSLIGQGLIGAIAYVTVAYVTLLDSSEREIAQKQISRLAKKFSSK